MLFLTFCSGIPTLVVAAASGDVVISISLFGVFLGLAFSDGMYAVLIWDFSSHNSYLKFLGMLNLLPSYWCTLVTIAVLALGNKVLISF